MENPTPPTGVTPVVDENTGAKTPTPNEPAVNTGGDAPSKDKVAQKKEATVKAVEVQPRTVEDNISDFFKSNPNAETVLRVGECLFLTSHRGAADEYGSRNSLAVQEIVNPKMKA